MTVYTGRDIKVGIARESSGRGTPVAATYYIPRNDFSFEDKANVVIDEQGYGVIEDSVDEKITSKWAEGDLGGLVRSKAIGLLLYNALGSSSPTGASGSPSAGLYTHTITVSQSHEHPSITITVDDPTEGDRTFALAMLNTLEISAERNEFVTFSANMMAKSSTPSTATPSYVSETSFISPDVTAKFKPTLSGIGGKTNTVLKSATITIEKELEKDDVLGKIDPENFLNKTLRVSIEMTKNYENTTFKDMYMTSSPTAMRLGIVSSSGSPIGLTVDLNQVKITEWATEKGLDDLITETFTAKANFKLADSQMIKALLVNDVASY